MASELGETLPVAKRSQSRINVKQELAETYREVGRMHESTGLYDELLLTFRNQLETLRTEKGSAHPATLSQLNLIGVTCLKAHRPTQAVKAFQEAWQLATEDGQFKDNASFNLGVAYSQAGEHARARELLQQFLDRIDETEPQSFMSFYGRIRLGEVMLRLGESETAETLLREGREGLRGIEEPSTQIKERLKLADELLEQLNESSRTPTCNSVRSHGNSLAGVQANFNPRRVHHG